MSKHTQVEPDAVEQLALSGFDAAYGARPLKRLVTKALESPLSRAILNGELHAGDTAAFVVEHERLALQIRRGDEAPARFRARAPGPTRPRSVTEPRRWPHPHED